MITTLNGAINSGVVSLTVANASDFPNIDNFRILIDTEIMIVTAVAGNVFTVVRGAETTTAAAHSNGVFVYAAVTEGYFQEYRKDNAESGVHSSLIVSKEGRLLLPSDAPYLLRDDGSVFNYYGPIWKLKPPKFSDFVWLNQGTASVKLENGGIWLQGPSAGAGANLKILKKTISGTKVTIFAIPQWDHENFLACGIGFRNSSNGKMVSCHWIHATTPKLEVIRMTSPTVFGAAVFNMDFQNGVGDDINWLRIENDGVNLRFYYSTDGYNFFELYSETIASWIAIAPNEAFFYVNVDRTAGYFTGIHLLSWEES